MTILNTLQCIKTENDRWILVEKIREQPGDQSRIIKRHKAEYETFDSKSYRGTRVALSYNDIRQEFDSVLSRMRDAIHKQLGI
jgi:hypothetical protein